MRDQIHSFYIPVMGTAFTIASPIQVARYGISSVISCVDDGLIEKMRKFYSKATNREYIAITSKERDSRARRITAYLNLLDQLVKEQFEKLKTSAFEIGSEITKYFELLADNSPLKQLYKAMLDMTSPEDQAKVQEDLRQRLQPGSIDVNVMTKLDRTNYDADGNPLSGEYSDALAALRGYARSTLNSAIVFSAGFNGRLYSYAEQFEDFHADENGFIKKKIVIKVSDYRSAYTQGKFFAKKGLWVSEYRMESGLNCGGHAFPHAGSLMGPTLEEFKQKKQKLIDDLFKIYNKALQLKGRRPFATPHPVRITAQGGIGTAFEHDFLRDYYEIEATGWGTPFLLVPEATTVDQATLEKLCQAGPDELWLSDVSPLGIPFNNLRNSASELTKLERIERGRPGSPCTQGYLATNVEFSDTPICLASSRYQRQKLLEVEQQGLTGEEAQTAVDEVLVKSCLCCDLGGAAILKHDLQEPGGRQTTPAVCPGPNLAYFSRILSLSEMVGHIYGRTNVLNDAPRPNMFVSELIIYIDYLTNELRKSLRSLNDQKVKFLNSIKSGLTDGIAYYETLIPKMTNQTSAYREQVLQDLHHCKAELEDLLASHETIFA